MAVMAAISATAPVMTNAGGIIGFCVYQPETASYAACCAFVPLAGTYVAINMSPAIWNALPAASRKLDAATLASYVKGTDPTADMLTRWNCILGDNTTAPDLIEAGTKGAACGKIIPGAAQGSDTDPAFTIGDLTVFTYNSEQTTAQAVDRRLGAATGFQGNEFYSYSVNTGALSGLALGAATISALVLSHF